MSYYEYNYVAFGRTLADKYDTLLETLRVAYLARASGEDTFINITKNGVVIVPTFDNAVQMLENQQAYFCKSGKVELETIRLLLKRYEQTPILSPDEKDALRVIHAALWKLQQEFYYEWLKDDEWLAACVQSLKDSATNAGPLQKQLIAMFIGMLEKIEV